jgi:glycine amidinotransferase/scyllo-inosamine-4-phosphate amidinotransferase 1
MKIHSYNEWDRLRSVVVGSALGANWPADDPVFAQEAEKTAWRETPPPAGAVPDWIQQETEEDLDRLVTALVDAGVEVLRPQPNDFVATRGMYNYCPRDRVIIAGDTVVDTAMMYPCRDQEIHYLEFLVQYGIPYRTMQRDRGLVLDAANVCRLNDDWLFLHSASGNRAAYHWLCEQFPHIRIHLCDFYAGVHIDSTICPLREGLVMLNASRVTEDNLPSVLRSWDKIWVEDCVARDFYQYPYASKWIGMNVLSIDPDTVIVDRMQIDLIRQIQRHGLDVVPMELRHSRTLGGGFHCVTLDLHRQG